MNRHERERAERNRRVEEILGAGVICKTCGASINSYADQCSAALDYPCEGFSNIEAAIDQARDEAAHEAATERAGG